MEKATAWLKKTLDYEFSDTGLLEKALTHRSAASENNERLEFLGDSVLQLVISERLYAERTHASEGQLSRLRAKLVKDATLGEIGTQLGLGEFLILGSGERKSGGNRRVSILADTMEAIFGAIYLDAGLPGVRTVIHRVFAGRIIDLPEGSDLRDPKSRLQEYLQGRKLLLPDYAIETITGKAHRQSFVASCSIEQLSLKTLGSGTTRRDAEQEAALEMLGRIEVAA